MILVSDGLSLAGLSVATALVGTAGRDRPEVLNRVLTPTTDETRARATCGSKRRAPRPRRARARSRGTSCDVSDRDVPRAVLHSGCGSGERDCITPQPTASDWPARI